MSNERNDPPAHRPSSAPRLLLLGPSTITVTGPAPRSSHRCLELVAYIHFSPGTTVARLCDVFCASSGSIRWAIVQARQWLGANPADGVLYLPAAYTGGYQLCDLISSDLTDLLTLPPATDLSNAQLRAGLELSRGPAFAGDPAHSWTWAEDLRIRAAETIRDLAHELTRRALDDHDIRTARWAAAHGLGATPEDEILLADRLRTELAAGSTGEAIRMAERIRHQAGRVGIPPLPETRQLLATAVQLQTGPEAPTSASDPVARRTEPLQSAATR